MRCSLSVCRILLALATASVTAAAARAADAEPGEPADPALSIGDAHLALPALREVGGDPAAPWAAAAAYTGALASDDGVALVAGAHAAVSGFDCALVELTAHGELATSHAADLAQYRVCLLGAPIRMVIAGAHGDGLAPALDARRSLWARRYDQEQLRYEMGLGELWDPRGGSPYRHSIMMMGFEHDVTQQADGAGAQQTAEIRGDLSLYRLRRTTPGSEFQIDAGVYEVDAVKAGPTDLGGVAASWYPVAITADAGAWFGSVRVGAGSLGGRASLVLGGETNGVATGTTRDSIDAAGLPESTSAVGDATFGVRRGEVTASGAVARAVFATFDGNQAREARASARLQLVHGKTRVAVAPFVARTRTWTRDAASRRDVAAGATLTVGRALSHHLDLDAVGEAGRSPYAALASVGGARSPVSVTGGQILVALGVHRGVHHPR